VTLPKHEAGLHTYRRRHSKLQASCLAWLRGRVWYCNAYLASTISSFGFLFKLAKCSLSCTSAAITYSAGWKGEGQGKAGKSKNRCWTVLTPKTLERKAGAPAVSRFYVSWILGGQAKTRKKNTGVHKTPSYGAPRLLYVSGILLPPRSNSVLCSYCTLPSAQPHREGTSSASTLCRHMPYFCSCGQLTGTTTMLLHFRIRDFPDVQPKHGGVQDKQC
jgi:hypothetical protein